MDSRARSMAPPQIWGPGNPEILGPKNYNHKILKMQIRSAQNAGKVWISRKKSSWPYLGPSQVMFPWSEKILKMYNCWPFSLVGQWTLFTRFGPLLLSTWGWEIGRMTSSGGLSTFFSRKPSQVYVTMPAKWDTPKIIAKVPSEACTHWTCPLAHQGK